MSRRPQFCDTAIAAAFGLNRPPATFDRSGRVRLLGEFAEAALSGKRPSKESVMFVAGAIAAWLDRGGDLERDYLEVTAKAGSHHTPALIWQNIRANRSSRGATGTEQLNTIPLSPSSSEEK